MHITITWWTWFLGSRLVGKCLTEWHAVAVVSRSAESVRKRRWERVQPIVRDAVSAFPGEQLKWTECVVHLMGESLAAFRRSNRKKERIWNSRIHTTGALVSVLPDSCHTFVCGSAIGIYPSSASQQYTERTVLSEPKTFLERVCHAREAEAAKAKTSTRRVVSIRTSLVLGSAWLLPLIAKATRRWGGVILWNENRHFSRVHEADRVGAVYHSIGTSTVHGPVNVVAPQKTTFSQFTYAVARAVHRPVRLRIPEWVLHVMQWEAAQLITADQYVLSEQLQKSGYQFLYHDLNDAIRDLLHSAS